MTTLQALTGNTQCTTAHCIRAKTDHRCPALQFTISRKPLCNNCNLLLNEARTGLKIFFHNLKGIVFFLLNTYYNQNFLSGFDANCIMLHLPDGELYRTVQPIYQVSVTSLSLTTSSHWSEEL